MADITSSGSSASMANRGPPEISEEWWGLDHMRVREAVLYSRRASSEDWQRLGDSYVPLGRKKLPWNVEQISISGTSIQVCQLGSQYKKDKSQPGGGQNEDEYVWRVIFPLGHLEDVWVSEGERQGRALPVVTIRLKIVTAPESSDSSKRFEDGTTEESTGDEQNEDLRAEDNARPQGNEKLTLPDPPNDKAANPANTAQITQSAVEQLLDDDTPMEDHDDQPKDTTTFPLARLFTPPPSTTNLEIRLDFQRAGAGKGPYRWIWPAVIRFLGHHEKWTCLTKAKDFSKTYGEPFYLDAWLEENKGKCGAKVKSKTTGGRKEWSISPMLPPPSQPTSIIPSPPIQAPNPLTELATQPPSVAKSSTADVKGAGKPSNENASEENELAILEAKIESLRSARNVCRDDWKRLREEADAAMGRYMEIEDELESLEGRRRDQLRIDE